MAGLVNGDMDWLGALEDPVRRRLFLFVAGRAEAVSRGQAAEAVGVSRRLAAFHLDKLLDAGLLESEYRHLGRGGRGAGRSSKLYRRAGEVALHVPPRSYPLVGAILAEALDGLDGGAGAVKRTGARAGRRVGATMAGPGEADGRDGRDRVEAALTALGYQPEGRPREIVLNNCPFDALARQHRDLVCGANHAFLSGLLAGMGERRWRARLAPGAGGCCVVLSPV